MNSARDDLEQLYSQTAVEARSKQRLGTIILMGPGAFKFVALLVGMVLLAFLILIYAGSYSRKISVKGELVPVSGVLKLYPMRSGVVLESFVNDGDLVRENQKMMSLSFDSVSAPFGMTERAVGEQLKLTLGSLDSDRHQAGVLFSQEQTLLQDEASQAQADVERLNRLIEVQRSRLNLAEENAHRYRKLYVQDYISKEESEIKQSDYLEQSARLQTLQRERAGANLGIKSKVATLEKRALAYQAQLSEIDKKIYVTNEALARSALNQGSELRAPKDGIATVVTARAGQFVSADKPLMTIVPVDAQLIAEVYAPSSAIGFVKPGDPVSLRYPAFPYQKFGLKHGRVITVARASLLSKEISTAVGLDNAESAAALFKVTIELDQQWVEVYGVRQALIPGMLVEASIILENRKLYEWALEPVISVTGRL
ncbi:MULTISPECIES: HlyD family secretion protein [unclassified Pseudomonas]|uniref:HlyD family secretion protein n=1 Tax=unclassified Pseudomonas TaxID=196821 RepID=UPI001304BEEE|nr:MULTISPECIES: HlyD family efflux transporter periplasmic adaptor subunit [unclassified Pseudomonas]